MAELELYFKKETKRKKKKSVLSSSANSRPMGGFAYGRILVKITVDFEKGLPYKIEGNFILILELTYNFVLKFICLALFFQKFHIACDTLDNSTQFKRCIFLIPSEFV